MRARLALKTIRFLLVWGIAEQCIFGVPQAVIEPNEATRVDRLIPERSRGVQVPTVLRQFGLRTTGRGRSLEPDVRIIFDTLTHQYWWNSAMAPIPRTAAERAEDVDWFSSHAAVFSTSDSLVVFWDQSPGQLLVLERRGLAAATIDDAESQIMQRIRTGSARDPIIEVPLHLPLDFWIPPNSAATRMRTTTVTDVKRDGERWKIVLKDRWEQELVLDDSYNLVDTHRLRSGRGDVQSSTR